MKKSSLSVADGFGIESKNRQGIERHTGTAHGNSKGIGSLMEEYLTIAEVAERLKVKPKTLKNKMAAGIFKRGVHKVKLAFPGCRVIQEGAEGVERK